MDSIPNPEEAGSRRGSSHSPKSPGSSSKKKSSKPSGQPQGKRTALQEARRKGRMDRSRGEEEMTAQLRNLVREAYCKESVSSCPFFHPVGSFCQFLFCSWVSVCLPVYRHVECPARVSTIMEKAQQEGLVSRCVQVEVRDKPPRARSSDSRMPPGLRVWGSSPPPRDLARESAALCSLCGRCACCTAVVTDRNVTTGPHRESIDRRRPVCPQESFRCARLAAGSLLQLVDEVMASRLRNGFSVARPPGHHAHVDRMNGYSMFNSVAIAARHARERHGLERFQEDPSVLYFSVHRYEDGCFWPHLVDSGGTAAGTGAGRGYNINVPWNQVGMKDADYIAAFQQLLLPVAYEFQPQLVLVAAGFDAVIGDPKGGMAASPQCFSVLTHLLQGLAQGRVLLALEGGYNLQSTAEGACACLRSLLGDPCPRLAPPGAPCDSGCLAISPYVWLCCSMLRLGCGCPRAPSHHPELPQRIFRIFSRHQDLGLLSRCHRIPARHATEEELAMCHRYGGGRGLYWNKPSARLFPTVPETLRASLPSLKQQSRRSAEQKGKRLPGQAATPRRSPRLGSQPATPEQGAAPVSPPERGSEEKGRGVQDITQGLLMLDLDTPSSSPANPSPASLPVGGARRKAKPAPLESSDVIGAGGERSDAAPQPTLEPTEGRESGDLVLKVESCEVEVGLRGNVTLIRHILLQAYRCEGPLRRTEHVPGGASDPAGGDPAGDSPGGECGASVRQVVLFLQTGARETGEVQPGSRCAKRRARAAPGAAGVARARRSGAVSPCPPRQVLCGRYVSGHMVAHGLASGHALVLSFADLSVWCYDCEAYVHNEVGGRPGGGGCSWAGAGAEGLAFRVWLRNERDFDLCLSVPSFHPSSFPSFVNSFIQPTSYSVSTHRAA
nr:PREDICTED: histone deacetylase 6 [Lepisosteus oculatus]